MSVKDTLARALLALAPSPPQAAVEGMRDDC